MRKSLFPIFCIVLSLAAPAAATSALPESGHSAVWFDAENPGTGWVLEMLGNDRAAAYWYGFDEQGRPVWRVGEGELVENDPVVDPPSESHTLEFDHLWAGSGARFGDDFAADDVVLERVGSLSINFDSCAEGMAIVRDASGGEASEPLNRLTETMGAGCAPLNGIPGFPVKSYAGQSGTWYDPARNGEGITLQWTARDEAVLYWFTYDLDGNPFWLLGLGVEEDGDIVFGMLYSAESAPNGEVTLTEWGSLALDLGCNTGTLTWASVVEGYGEGSFDLTRLNALARPACPTVKPKLNDLYELEVIDLPIPEDRQITVRDIADDGTIVGIELLENDTRTLEILPPGSDNWEDLGGPAVDWEQAILMSPDAQRVLAGEGDLGGDVQPLEWSDVAAGQPLIGFRPGAFRLQGGSSDRGALTGSDGAAQPWSWDALRGVRSLPLITNPESGTGVAVAASNDGRVVVGIETVPRIGTPPPDAGFQPGIQGLIWDEAGIPSLLRDPEGFTLAEPGACSADCDIVYGVHTVGVPQDSERRLQPWFWTEDGRFGALEGLTVQEEDGRPIWSPKIRKASADGTIALGDATSLVPASPAIPPIAFVWTQATDIIVIGELLEEIGADIPQTTNAGSRAIALSASGRRILFSDLSQIRVLVLTPKSP